VKHEINLELDTDKVNPSIKITEKIHEVNLDNDTFNYPMDHNLNLTESTVLLLDNLKNTPDLADKTTLYKKFIDQIDELRFRKKEKENLPIVIPEIKETLEIADQITDTEKEKLPEVIPVINETSVTPNEISDSEKEKLPEILPVTNETPTTSNELSDSEKVDKVVQSLYDNIRRATLTGDLSEEDRDYLTNFIHAQGERSSEEKEYMAKYIDHTNGYLNNEKGISYFVSTEYNGKPKTLVINSRKLDSEEREDGTYVPQ